MKIEFEMYYETLCFLQDSTKNLKHFRTSNQNLFSMGLCAFIWFLYQICFVVENYDIQIISMMTFFDLRSHLIFPLQRSIIFILY